MMLICSGVLICESGFLPSRYHLLLGSMVNGFDWVCCLDGQSEVLGVLQGGNGARIVALIIGSLLFRWTVHVF